MYYKKLSPMIIGLLLMGCMSAHVNNAGPEGKLILEDCSIRVFGDISDDDKNLMKVAFHDMTPAMRHAVEGIAIYKDKKHFDGYATPNHGGHCFHRTLCATRSHFDEIFLYHETAHALTYKLEEDSSAFIKEWRAIAGDVYTRSFEKKKYPWDKLNPGEGLASGYGATNEREDIAEWAVVAYGKTRHWYSERSPLASFFDKKKIDPRIPKKLELLSKYGFIK